MLDLAAGIEKGGVVDEQRDPTTSEDEDFEGHKLSERPTSESPTSERSSEEPDVEGHALTERPTSERPTSE